MCVRVCDSSVCVDVCIIFEVPVLSMIILNITPEHDAFRNTTNIQNVVAVVAVVAISVVVIVDIFVVVVFY